MLEGTCQIKWKGELYDKYKISHFIWDLVSSNIIIRVQYHNSNNKSIRNKDFTIEGKEHIDINDLINEIHEAHRNASSW